MPNLMLLFFILLQWDLVLLRGKIIWTPLETGSGRKSAAVKFKNP